MSPVLITVSCPSASEAAEIVRAVVHRRLAAAGQTWPITSTYWWDGEVVDRDEFTVLFKTVETRVSEVVEVIGAMHSYETPSIAVVPVSRTGPGVECWLVDSMREDSGAAKDTTIPELV